MIFSIGELSEWKNHSVVIKAMDKLNSNNFYYIICGEGDKKEELVQLAENFGLQNRVIFIGQIKHDDVIDLCYVCNIGALPSKIEGLGIAGIETLATGKPLVVSNVHGIKDYVVNYETGILVIWMTI